jgi:hypothetical protein
VNSFPERLLLATDGLEHTALADRAAVDLAKKGDAKKSASERRNHEAFAPSSHITHFHCNLAYRGFGAHIEGTSGA